MFISLRGFGPCCFFYFRLDWLNSFSRRRSLFQPHLSHSLTQIESSRSLLVNLFFLDNFIIASLQQERWLVLPSYWDRFKVCFSCFSLSLLAHQLLIRKELLEIWWWKYCTYGLFGTECLVLLFLLAVQCDRLIIFPYANFGLLASVISFFLDS